ncbi:MAG TPA: hypothetical protein VMO81_11665 [Aestuariivirgaceae bacterium]|nr:hypothetical protein [Aestuariivirgaceae bacterium]
MPSGIIFSRFQPEQGFTMKTFWIMPTAAVAAAHFLIAGALAAPPAGSGVVALPRADVVRVQAIFSPGAPADRMARLRQHRSILQNALQPVSRAVFAEPPEPQARALRPPGPMIVTAPQQEQVTCEDAARIVSDFGFSDIGNQECSGDLYRFSAMRDGTAYAIAISATGKIAEVSRR